MTRLCPLLAGLVLLGCLLAGCVEQAPATLEPGRVLGAAPVQQADETIGAGAVAGAVVGAGVGGAIGGRGASLLVGAIAGAAAGGTAGSVAEAASQSSSGVAYTVQLLDGRVTTVMQHRREGEPILAAGSQVAVETRGRFQRVIAAVSPN